MCKLAAMWHEMHDTWIPPQADWDWDDDDDGEGQWVDLDAGPKHRTAFDDDDPLGEQAARMRYLMDEREEIENRA